ncbi:MAG: hypothetical protein O2877_02545 [bacterium]|nr:hypothetical protein [bacterium]
MSKLVIFLDWHGTLSESVFWNSFEEGSAKESFLRQKITDEIFTLDGSDPNSFMGAWDRGEMTSEEFVAAISEHVEEDNNWLWFRFVEDCKRFALDSLSYIDQITDLRMYAKVVLATDQGEAFERFILPALQLDSHFDDMIISASKGASKVEPEKFFEDYLPLIQEGRALLVDNSHAGCRRFCDLGGHAIHINEEVKTTQALSDALKWARSQPYGA